MSLHYGTALFQVLDEPHSKALVHLQHTINAVIRRGESFYVAECMEIPVLTQGRTLDEVVANLQEAVALHLQDEDLSKMGLATEPTLVVTLECEPAHA